MDDLKQATGADAAKMSSRVMTKHHQGARANGPGRAEERDDAAIRELAKHITTSQQADIESMKQLLADLSRQRHDRLVKNGSASSATDGADPQGPASARPASRHQRHGRGSSARKVLDAARRGFRGSTWQAG